MVEEFKRHILSFVVCEINAVTIFVYFAVWLRNTTARRRVTQVRADAN